jgi:hypothetical protein
MVEVEVVVVDEVIRGEHVVGQECLCDVVDDIVEAGAQAATGHDAEHWERGGRIRLVGVGVVGMTSTSSASLPWSSPPPPSPPPPPPSPPRSTHPLSQDPHVFAHALPP